jgi:hypothetical protein
MLFVNKIEKWFTDHCVFLAAIPGFLFWSLAGMIFRLDFMQTFAALVVTKMSLNFLYTNVYRLNEYMSQIDGRPFFSLYAKISNVSFLNKSLHVYLNWQEKQDFFSHSVFMAVDEVLLFFLLIIAAVASICDYCWVLFGIA